MLTEFTTLPAISGHYVIDAEGRPLDWRETKRSANGVAFKLNRAAADGALAQALGAGKQPPATPSTSTVA